MRNSTHIAPDRLGTPLTARQLETMRAYSTTGSMKEAAHRLGIGLQCVKNHTSSSYRRLGVDNAIEAFVALGWLQPPDGAPEVHRHVWVCEMCLGRRAENGEGVL